MRRKGWTVCIILSSVFFFQTILYGFQKEGKYKEGTMVSEQQIMELERYLRNMKEEIKKRLAIRFYGALPPPTQEGILNSLQFEIQSMKELAAEGFSLRFVLQITNYGDFEFSYPLNANNLKSPLDIDDMVKKLFDMVSVKWGVLPDIEVVSQIEEWLYSSGEAIVVLDRNYPTSMSGEGFEHEIKKLSEQIKIPHKIEYDLAFRAIFRKKEELFAKEIDRDPAVEKLSSANEGFAFKFYSQLIGEGGDKNIVISPLSIAIALSVVYNGAGGNTKEAIGNVLGAAGIKLEDINHTYELFLSNIKKADPEVNIAIANSLWAKEDKRFREDFLKAALSYYGAKAANVDFENPDAVDKINRWVNKKTRGKISHIVDETIRDSVLLIINALYFKGIWEEIFEEKMTKEDTFYLINGTEKKVQMMFQKGEYNYLSNSEFQAISLPYGRGRVSMYVFLPEKKMDIIKFHRLLNQKNWRDWMPRFKKREGRIGLPRFRQEYGRDLKDILAAMGMQTAFDTEHANFEGIFQDSANIFISRIKHKTFIEVNERGTEAGAVTSDEMLELLEVPPEEPFNMIVNRPFFFAIRDNESGMMLFIGSIIDPIR
jgi:serpin B